MENGIKLSRRTILAATAVSIGSVGSTAQGADSGSRTQLAQGNPDYQKTGMPLTIWSNEKARLADRFPWMASFKHPQLVDSIVYEVTTRLVDKPLAYDPYQVEALLSSASTLLDRCLIYRREMFDLEEQAVRRALEYDLFNKQADALREIELAPYIEEQRKVEKRGQQNAASEFAASSPSDLGKGFSEISQASANSSDIAITGEQRRKQSVQVKWKALREYQAALEDRHNTLGHALNYQERYNRIRGYLEQDLSLAYQKARSIDFAVERIFGLVERLEPPTRVGYLDRLVSYIRDTIVQSEAKVIEEIEFEHVVSIRQPRALDTSARSELRHLSDAQWDALLGPAGDGRLTIDLGREFPSSIHRLRLRGVGASILVDAPSDGAARQRTLAIVLFPPDPAPWTVPVEPQFLRRSPIILERLGPSDQRQEPGSYASVNNIDPRGTWTIQVSSNVLWTDGKVHSRADRKLRDIKLHLRLSATVEKDPSNAVWKSFFF